jgi:hypothetical protein
MKTERVVIALVFSFALMLVSACPSQAQSTNAAETLNQSTNSQPSAADFQQAVLAYQQSPSEATAEKVVKMATAMDQLPPIPEEARKHFVRGGTLLKAAKFPDDFKEVIDEFTQATHLAPWWPNARYNLAVAQEAAGDYIIALNNLKLYQLFKLTEDEARVAQDKIYAVEAEKEKAEKEAKACFNQASTYKAAGNYADAIKQFKLYLSFKLPENEADKNYVQEQLYFLEAKQEEATKKAEEPRFEGTWSVWPDRPDLDSWQVRRISSGTYTVTHLEPANGGTYPDADVNNIGATVGGRNIDFKFYRAMLGGVNITFSLTLSDDENELRGSTSSYNINGSSAYHVSKGLSTQGNVIWKRVK